MDDLDWLLRPDVGNQSLSLSLSLSLSGRIFTSDRYCVPAGHYFVYMDKLFGSLVTPTEYAAITTSEARVKAH
jgi:hypothetical protein